MAALFAVAAGAAAGRGASNARNGGVLSACVGVAAVGCAHGMLRRRVEEGPDGLRFRTALRWRTLEWNDIHRLEDLRVAAPDSRIRTPSRGSRPHCATAP